jgi:hypothetical protein
MRKAMKTSRIVSGCADQAGAVQKLQELQIRQELQELQVVDLMNCKLEIQGK